MAHTSRCADSASTRSECHCDRSLHGVWPGPIYRTLYAAHANDVTPDQAERRAADETVVEVPSELIRRAPDDLEQVRGIVGEVLIGRAWLLLGDGGKPSK
jgi:hypothetical protein